MGRYSKANKLCECGSGKKYKKCCLNKKEAKKGSKDILFELLHETINVFELKRDELENRINLIETLIANSELDKEEYNRVNLYMYQLYSFIGEDKKSLDIINNCIDSQEIDNLFKINLLSFKLKALVNLNLRNELIENIIELKDIADSLDWNDQKHKTVKSGALIECARVLNILATEYYIENGEELDNNLLISIYDELINNYELGNYNDIDHYTGAKSGKASILLRNESKDIQEQGLIEMNQAINLKAQSGYWNGVANSYSTLSLYYLKIKNYKQAIAYTKRDLKLTREYGSFRDEISTLNNLSYIYVETLQIKKAREVLKEALVLSEKINNSAIAIFLSERIEKINDIAKKLNMEGKKFGPKTKCVCGSGLSFEECCGEADYSYESIDKLLGLNTIVPYTNIVNKSCEEGVEDNKSTLNLILRKLDKGEIRLAWNEIIFNGAYQEVYELPDMSSIHLVSAKSILENSTSDDLIKETSIALSSVMLSVSALEAFINQLIYFLKSLALDELPGFIRTKIPNELMEDHLSYQRNERFIDKINTIADIFCNGKWSNGAGKLKEDLLKLISIRNELVHFKSVEYLKIIPPQKEDKILKNLSNEVELREVSNSWPFKVLNKSFAKWSIKTIEETIDYIKTLYINNINKNL
ncbi:SEC-C metal-binding domain-containing protein [Clostridium perfringens]|uniref:SEC-C metal-binding domain-containing protein n=1 Tax=Clostridium perfringens TaxID=1502 RepID=UPI0023F8EBEB|nr:SEC-C metal-binding domain-containing protein [Clostridium perfringens]WEV18641.1 SEC-C metal-binding domain-containing protein [Clostridium perfringens D]